MTKSTSIKKQSRKQYTPEFRQETLKMAERIGVAAAARELSLMVRNLERRFKNFLTINSSVTHARVAWHSKMLLIKTPVLMYF